MKVYQRTEWYGLHYLFQYEGSVIPTCMPVVLFACGLNYLIVRDHISLTNDAGGDALAESYTLQLIGLVVGYLTVYRLQLSYNRYWEGVTMVKNMHSKWADACGQVISFDRSMSSESDLTSDPFCCHIVRLFSQMSAMATMRLHVVEPGESILFEALESKRASDAKLQPLRVLKTCKTMRLSGRKGSPPKAGAAGGAGKVASMHHSDGAHEKKKKKTDKIKELAAGISPAERRLLIASPDPVFATAQRIQRAIMTRFHSGGMGAPPPIISRIFQEISNGLLAYNNATKMKEIPVPFAYVQLNALFTNLFAPFLIPVAVATFTPTLWLSLLSTAFSTLCYYALFIVANQLEDPFGAEANDMPMLSYHEEFCAMLCATMTMAWLPEDQWLVKQGKWIRPKTVGLAANAFFDTIGSSKHVKFTKEASLATPHDSLLNRAKMKNGKRGRISRLVSSVGPRKKEAKFPGLVNPDGFNAEAELENDMATVIQRANRSKKAREETAKRRQQRSPSQRYQVNVPE